VAAADIESSSAELLRTTVIADGAALNSPPTQDLQYVSRVADKHDLRQHWANLLAGYVCIPNVRYRRYRRPFDCRRFRACCYWALTNSMWRRAASPFPDNV